MAPSTHHQALLSIINHRKEPSLNRLLLFPPLPIVAILIILSPTVLSSTHQRPETFSDTLPISLVCKNSHDPSSCHAMVSEATSNNKLFQTNTINPLKVFLTKSKAYIQEALTMANNLQSRVPDKKDRATVIDCVGLMDLSKDRVVDSLDALTLGSHDDVHAWLSAVLTNYFACLDGLSGPARPMMEPRLNVLIARERASLAMLLAMKHPSRGRHMLEKVKDGFPYWVTNRDRKLLKQSLPRIKGVYKPNVVVTRDGSGNYRTVGDAVASAPNNSKTRYIIYVKKGTYKENVVIGNTKKNIMLVGDGMNLTVITGSLNMADGTTTFNSATVAAVGDGFMAQDIWFQNTAGPQKGQAVALRVGADRSIIYRCRIDAYQDTLYAFSLRQFYRDSIVMGTIDFIFGNAAVVFQNCQIIARKPLAGQADVLTAQSRQDPNQNTGTSIQNCQIIASADLEHVKGSVKTFLGRPWMQYSRTVVMESYLGDLIDPAGWTVWDGDFALSTLYYGEYANTGPGSGTIKRVTWPGYHAITSPAVANDFTVAQLIQGSSWIQPAGVPYTNGLS